MDKKNIWMCLVQYLLSFVFRLVLFPVKIFIERNNHQWYWIWFVLMDVHSHEMACVMGILKIRVNWKRENDTNVDTHKNDSLENTAWAAFELTKSHFHNKWNIDSMAHKMLSDFFFSNRYYQYELFVHFR